MDRRNNVILDLENTSQMSADVDNKIENKDEEIVSENQWIYL